MEELILKTKDFNARYDKRQVLKDINFSFPKNKITAIIGHLVVVNLRFLNL